MVSVQRQAAIFLPPGVTNTELGGPHDRFGQVQKISQLGFDPQTIQPVASLYTDYSFHSHREK
jgi:hypothetical protein